jgi:hypothetical protein
MATIQGFPTITGHITIRLSEEEAGALDALVGYGAEEFLKAFYQHLGQAYLKPHESGLKSLFESVRTGDASVSFIPEKVDPKVNYRKLMEE